MSWVFVMQDTTELDIQTVKKEPQKLPKIYLGQYALRAAAGVLWFMNAFDIPIRLW